MKQQDKTVSAALPEQLTMHSAAKALESLGRALTQVSGPTMLLDGQALRVVDSSAVAVLLELRRRLLAQGKSLELKDPPQRLRDLVALYGVGELLFV
jgi:phospholipid transport system transporter-binding protein